MAAVAVTSSLVIGFAALAVDMGVFYNTRVEAQRSADAAALAGAWTLLSDERVKGPGGVESVMYDSRHTANELAGLNHVFKRSPQMDLNLANNPDGDIVLGRLINLQDRSEQLATGVPGDEYNAVSVLVRLDDVRNGPVPFFFGQIFGLRNKNISARAVAAAQNNITGFRVTPTSGNANLMPFTIHIDAWNGLLAGTLTSGDDFRYDPETGEALPGPDGINELNMYPGAGTSQLPPGNFGTVNIGDQNNSTADLRRQILEGISAEDLAYHGGELTFNENGKLYLSGDPGLSAAIKTDLEAIKGQPRTILLFTEVAGPGNNAIYTIVGFAGIRVVDVHLTGSMKSKAVCIQPAVSVDPTAVPAASDTFHPSYFVYCPPTLVR